MKNKKLMFWMIIALVIAAAVVIIKKPTKLGLDLVGGSRIVLEAQTTDTIAKITPDMICNRKQSKRTRCCGNSCAANR